MDFTPITKFVSAHWLEIGGILTLGFSLWIAFGPLRHYLPRFLIRLGKYSATLKLLFLSGVCWFTLYRFLTDDVPSTPANWLVGVLGIILLLAAIFVFTRKHHVPAPADSTRPTKTQGPPAKPATPARSSAPAPHA